jgi:iron complex outermembrane recepter protein
MKQNNRLVLLLILLLGNTVIFAQGKRTISGVVSDNTGLPLPAATVTQKNTNNSTVTDADGRYSISVEGQNVVLVFTSISFGTKEVSAGSSGTLNVTLEMSAGDLEGVVVTALGVSRQKKALGYASTTIAADDITRAGSPNFAAALYGKAPGVRIGSTPGGATSAVNINIRGINSITGRNQPLIVLDGVPIRDGEVKNNDYWGDQRLRGNGLLDINPEDIDNISILKGASAAALYGSEAVNGVLLITTKRGTKAGKAFAVNFNTNFAADEVAFLPRYQNVRGPGAPVHVSNAGQNAEGFIMVDTNGDGTPDMRSNPNFTINFGAPFDGKPILSWDGKVRPYEAQIDNYKGLFRTAYSSNINVAVSHRSENSDVRFSLTRQNNQGVSLGADNFRNIANFNSSFKMGKKFTTDVMINYVNQRTKNRPYSIDRMINNFTGMMGRFDNADWYLDRYITSKGYRFVTGTNQSLTPAENIKFPGFRADIADYVWRVKEHKEDEWSNRVIGSLTNHWEILKSLRLRTRIATDFTSLRSESRQRTEVPLAFGNSGYFGLSNQISSIVYGDVLLTYTHKFNQDFEVNVMGGYTASKQTETFTSRGTNGGLSTENLFDVAASVGLANSDSRRISLVKDAFIGTVNLGYKDYVFVEGTVRRDRTSVMHPDENSFVYPSVNSSLILSEAFNLPTIISYAKLRASWGIVGNYPDIYAANIAYNQNTLGVQESGGTPVLYTTLPQAFGNDRIRPEEKHEIEFGLETKFLNNRVGIEISYYNAQIRDQILPLTIPASSGATSVLTNIGTLRNKGIEISITGTPVKNKNWRWDLGINASQNTNTVEKLATGSDMLLHADYDGNAAQLISKVGEPMGDFYAHPVAKDSKGDMIVEPNGLHRLDPALVKVGNAMPKAIGGFFSSLTWKNFNLDAMLDFRVGGYVMPTGINWMISRGLLEESLKYSTTERGGISYYRNAQGQGVQTSAAQGPNGETVFHDGMLLPGVTANGQPNSNVISQAYYYWNTYNWGGPQYSYSRYELYIKKNSYVKFRELSIGYTLPERWAGKIKAKQLQLSVFGRNLFYLYRTLKDLDAEQTVAGSRWFQSLTNAGTNPSTRTMGVMLRASF